MSKLTRWLPFKFRRSEKEARRQDVARPESVHDLFRSVFSDPFFRSPLAGFGQLDRWFGDFAPMRFDPTVDVADEEDALRVTAELPGMDKDDIELSIDNNVLLLRGEKKNEHESREAGVYRSERYYGSFQRTIPLPDDIDAGAAEATFQKGVLSIRFPKTAPTEKTRKIEIQT